MGTGGYLDQLQVVTAAQLRAEVRDKARAATARLLAEPDAWQLVESPEAVPAAGGAVPVPVAN